ncbi:MAG TPA: Wzz/FepE/Etk N-terminal domain-containing protein [Capsulimonadaceae bacterium]
MSSITETDDLVIEPALLRKVFQDKARKWIPLGLLAAVLGTIISLAIIPQTYTSTTTVAIQQAGGDSSALSLLTGSKSNTRYIGVLKSRTAAEEVLVSTKFSRLFEFRTHNKAVEFVQQHLKVDEDPLSGLLNVSVTLPGPPRIALAGDKRTKAVRDLAAEMANSYVSYLRSYYVDTDNDRESVILRTAESETTKARSDYNGAIRRLTLFGRSMKDVDPRAIPNPSRGNAPSAIDDVGSLYSMLAKVETQIAAAQAASGATNSLTGGLLGDLKSLPSEDPLLSAARAKVAQDISDLQALQVVYGPDYPTVILAKNRLKLDQANLRAQKSGVQAKRTSERVVDRAQIENLEAQRKTLLEQIADSSKRVTKGLHLTNSFEQLKTEVEIQLAVLKTTLSEAARARMQYAAVQSRVSVIDPAIPADMGQPRLAIVIVVVLAIVFLAYIVSCLAEYRRRMTGTGREQLPEVPMLADSRVDVGNIGGRQP